jgi:hypothetical protein
MAGLLYAGFDYGRTADLADLWDIVSNVDLQPTAGRASGGAVFFDADLGSVMQVGRTWGDGTAVMGFSFLPVNRNALAGCVVAQLVSTAFTYRLLIHGNGAISVLQDFTERCTAGPDIVTPFGAYIEWRIDLTDASEQAITVRVDGLTVAHAALALVTPGEAFTDVALGDATLNIGQWWIDDVYLLDGVAAASTFQAGQFVIANNDFLGDVHVQGLLATADGYLIDSDPGYTPWTGFPSPVAPFFSNINENPPDDGTTKNTSATVGTPSGGTLDVYGTYQFTDTGQGTGFGYKPGGVEPWELYALQWIGHLQSSGGNTVKPTVRAVVAGPSVDQVALGEELTIPATVDTFAYQAVLFDRDPANSDDPWTFAAVFLVPGVAPARGTREFGIDLTS